MKKVAIGIDIGGTNTAIGIIDYEGKCLAESNISTAAFNTPELLVEEASTKIKSMLNSIKGIEVLGIGIGAPNGNFFNGSIEYAPNLKWKGVVNLVKLFKPYFNLPVYVTNDANAAAIGEMIYGVAKGVDDFIIVTLGTGVGSGFVSNGKLVYGHDAFAGELGHVIIDENGRQCGCGRKGCLETYASATGIVRTAKEYLFLKKEDSLLREIEFENITSKDIFEAAEKGDQIALDIFDFTARKLGFSLANAVAISSPKMIVLFGGLAMAGNLILQPTKKYMEEYMLKIYKDKIPIVLSSLMNQNAAILGASALVWDQIK